MVQSHTNYHCSMASTELIGIVDLDGEAQVKNGQGTVICYVSLREVIFEHVKLEGKTIFAELHQRGPMGKVEAVYPNTERHERVVDSMNKHMAAFLRNKLQDEKATTDFINELLRKCIDPALNHSAHECKWDGDTMMVTTADDVEANDAQAELEAMPFFVNKISEVMAENEKSNKKYSDPNALFNLDGERSVKTIHKANNGKYVQTVSPEVLDLSGGKASAANTAMAEPIQNDGSNDDSKGTSVVDLTSSDDSSSSKDKDESVSSDSSADSNVTGSDMSR